MVCPRCGNEIEKGTTICPQCGEEICEDVCEVLNKSNNSNNDKTIKNNPKLVSIIIVAISLLISIIIIFSIVAISTNKSSSSNDIDITDKEESSYTYTTTKEYKTTESTTQNRTITAADSIGDVHPLLNISSSEYINGLNRVMHNYFTNSISENWTLNNTTNDTSSSGALRTYDLYDLENTPINVTTVSSNGYIEYVMVSVSSEAVSANADVVGPMFMSISAMAGKAMINKSSFDIDACRTSLSDTLSAGSKKCSYEGVSFSAETKDNLAVYVISIE